MEQRSGSGTTAYGYAGNLVQVMEPNPVTSGQTYETYYTYDALNRLTGVSMPRPNVFGSSYTQTRSWVYSGALLASTTNPENGTGFHEHCDERGPLAESWGAGREA